MTPAVIDVLLPLYNAADTLEQSLESLAAQSFADFRVIAVNDGSIDATGEVLARWAARDPRFTYIDQPNGGIVKALNTGLAAVTAPYLARLDGDDLCLPERFARQHTYLEENSDCVAVGCWVRHIDAVGTPIDGLHQPLDPAEYDMDHVPAIEPYIIHPFLMTRSAAVRDAGGYRNVPHSEDSDLFWRLAERGRLYNLPETLGEYRMHVGSISSASLLNGRIMSVGSQLGAISAQRRRAGRADLKFQSDLISALRKADSLAAMCEQVAPMLDQRERAFLFASAAAKLLELTNYRPYELEPDDCKFVSQALVPYVRSTSAANQSIINWYLSRTGSRLARRGHIGAALRMVPGRLWPNTMLRTLLRR